VEPAPEGALERAREGSHYQVGDYVIYRYGGRLTPEAVTLTERISKKEGPRLTIEVEALRGSAARRWIQVVTDTPENKRKNVVDEIHERVGSALRQLANPDNRDLVRLYAWTLPPCSGSAQSAGKTELEMPVAGVRFRCECDKSLVECGGEPAQLELCDCPDFVWMHASGEARALATGEVLWKLEVAEFGNRLKAR
jgi:hypothetical protein